MKVNFEKIHAFYMTLDLNKHIESITRYGEVIAFNAGDKFTASQGSVFFIKNGNILASIPGSPLSIGCVVEHTPIGLMERYCPFFPFEYTCLSATEVISLSYEEFDKVFLSSADLTRELIAILSFMSVFAFELHIERSNSSSYHIIKPILKRYLYRQKSLSHENEKLAMFIIRRTNLSRAQVYRILSDLRKGGYITLEQGKLTSIDKELPKDY